MNQAFTPSQAVARRALLAVCMACASLGVAASGGQFEGLVLRVDDGDSLRLRDAQGRTRKVRLAFVDAPEFRQDQGREAAQQLRRLAQGRMASVHWHSRDRYQRYVGVVWVAAPASPCAAQRTCPRTLDLGLSQLGSGLAWWYRSYALRAQTHAARIQYERAETQARARRIGVWQSSHAQAPWQWRQAHPR